MSELKTIIGQCSLPFESRRLVATAFLTADFSYEANYFTDANNFDTVTITGSANPTWTRIPFPSSATGGTPPGDGNFYYIQYSCCCKCRTFSCFDDQTVGISPEKAGEISIPVTLTVRNVGESSGVPFDTTEDLSRTITILLWDLDSPPCKTADGPQKAQYGTVEFPSELFLVLSDPSQADDVEVTGNSNPSPTDPPFNTFNFTTTPDPCNDDQNYEMQIVETWSDNVTFHLVGAALTINFAFGFAPAP